MATTDGNYGGLGLTVTLEDGAVKVIAATRDTPADRAGIKAGDFITHVDGVLFFGGKLDEATDKMKASLAPRCACASSARAASSRSS
jgi:carboxyl-terminal processing protease